MWFLISIQHIARKLCVFSIVFFFSFKTYQNHILQCAQDRAILKMKVELKTDSSDKFVWGFLLLNHFFFSVLKIRVRCYEKSFWIYFLFSGLRGANVSWLWINFHIMVFFWSFPLHRWIFKALRISVPRKYAAGLPWIMRLTSCHGSSSSPIQPKYVFGVEVMGWTTLS